MTKDELVRLWEDPKHWRGGAMYYCPEDPRVVVPKRTIWGGWTVNFAHAKAAWSVILLSVVIAVAPTLSVVAMGILSWWPILAALGVSLTMLIIMGYRMSRGTHPEALPGIVLAILAICIPAGWACRAAASNPWAYPLAIAVIVGLLMVIGQLYAAMKKR